MTYNNIDTIFAEPDKKILDILLVEDNEGDIRLTKEALKESNFNSNLHVVKDGADALDFLEKDSKFEFAVKPDLILLDLNLPKKDGLEVLRSIKNNDELKTIPVIMLTTSSSSNDILNSYKLYANCFITKPVDFEEFINVIKRIEEFWFHTVKLPNN